MQSVVETSDNLAGDPDRRDGRDNRLPVLGVGLTSLLAALTVIFIAVRIPSLQTMLPAIAGYPSLHTGIETFVIVVCIMVFAVGWNTPNGECDRNTLVLSSAFLAVGLLDAAHTLAFPGMPDFVIPNTPEKAINFWMVARGVAGLAILASVLLPRRPCDSPLTRYWLLAAALGITALICWVILLHQDILPRTFIPGEGLTPFKIGVECFIIAIYLLAATVIYARLGTRPANALRHLFAATSIAALGEFFFIFFDDITDIYIQLGHMYKAIGYVLLYKALFVQSIEEPHRKLSQSRHDLQVSKERLQLALEGSNLAQFDVDVASGTVHLNAAWAAMLGDEPGCTVMSLESLMDLTHAEERQRIKEHYVDALTGRAASYDLDHRIVTRSGEWKWIRSHGRVVERDENGRAVRIAGTNADITERKQIEIALRESEERLSGIVLSAMHGIITVDEDMNIVLFNPSAENIFGYSAGDVTGTRIDRLIPERFRSAHHNHMKAFGASTTAMRRMTERGIITGIRANGEEFPAEASISHLTLNGKKLYTVILADVTDNLEAAKYLRVFAEVFETSLEGMIIADASGRIISVNPAFTSITGYAREEIVGEFPRALNAGLQDENFCRNMRISIKQSGHWQGEFWSQRKSGDFCCVWLSISTVRNERGEILYHTAIFSDITERVLSARSRAMEHAVTRVLAESATLDEAMPRMIRTMCEAMNWAYGARWAWNEAEQRLCRAEHWSDFVPDFEPEDRHFWFNLGGGEAGGLLRRAWLSKETTWLSNIRDDISFRRKPSCAKFGLHSAYSFPILAGNAVIGVMEFFGRELRPPDEVLLRITDAIGRQIGQFIQRTRAEEARANLAVIVEHSNDAIISRSLDGTILSWNAAAERMFGHAAADAIGRPATFILPPDRQSNLARNTDKVLRGERVPPYESRCMTKDGRLVDVLISHSPIRDSIGAIIGASVILHDISALRRAEAALIESEERFRAAFEQAGVGMALRGIDPRNSRWLRVNQKLCDILGYTQAELLQLTSVDVTPPEDRDVAIDYSEKLLNGEITSYSREKRYLRKDGSIVWTNVSLAAVRGPDGRPTHVMSVIEDITERKQAEEARARLAAIIASSQDAIIGRDLDGTIRSWNAGAERLFGYAAAEAIGRNISMLIPPDHQSRFLHNQALIAAGEAILPYETENVSKDGRRICAWLSLSPIKNSSGQVTGISAILHDITERKQAEEARSRLAAIVDNSNDAIIGRALDGTILSWNTAAERLYGYTAAEVIGRDLRMAPPERQREAMTNRGLLSEGRPVPSYETVRVTKDGRRIDVSRSMFPIKDQSGNVIGMAAIVQDVTERKRVEQEVLRLNAELEQRVIERTRQLEAINKELEAFSYSVSHDLRAPLRGIDGFSQMLLKKYADHLDDTGSDYLQRIRRATVRMGELIDDLLQLSRISGSQIKVEAVDLSQLTRSVLEDLQASESERMVVTEVQDGIEICGDPRLLKIALENLLGNAWKFTRKQEAAKIRFGTEEQNGERVVFVKDNGAGFNMKYAHKLFGAFQRLHGATEFEGTGIGLATVQRIVNLHGGRIWANATIGKGATFYLSIPRAAGNGMTTTQQGEAA